MKIKETLDAEFDRFSDNCTEDMIRIVPHYLRLLSSLGDSLPEDFSATRILVLFQLNIDMFRATQRRQDKAQPAENGAPLSRAATPYWRRCVALNMSILS